MEYFGVRSKILKDSVKKEPRHTHNLSVYLERIRTLQTMFVSLKIRMLNSVSKGMLLGGGAFRRCLGHEGTTRVGLMPLQKRLRGAKSPLLQYEDIVKRW